jgi:NodT family efflux transporter outer membrane factor (OMF) lipoprotein
MNPVRFNPRLRSASFGAASLSLVGAAALLALTGCAHPGAEDRAQRPAVDLPARISGAASAPGDAAQPSAQAASATIRWQALLPDERARQVVERALAQNADLKIAALNVERSRAQLRLSDADRWPTVNAVVSANRAPNTKGVQTTTTQAGLQISAWELDYLGRLADASDAAQASLLANEAARRSVRLALISQTLSAWLTLAADQQQQALAERTLRTRQDSLALVALRLKVGAASELDWRSAQTLVEQARASLAQWRRQTQQDLNALNLLLGSETPAAWLPPQALLADASSSANSAPAFELNLAPAPGELASDVLLARPDVIQAEQSLVAARANLSAARSALFPRITLSTSAGVVSDSLSGLFNAGTFAWTLGSQAAMALFDAGRTRATIAVADVNQQTAVLQYEKTVRTAFREAADALGAQSQWRDQTQAQRSLLAAERERHRLTRLKFDAGAASQLDWLDAERSLATAEQALVQAQLAEALNRVNLFKALGGDEGAGS